MNHTQTEMNTKKDLLEEWFRRVWAEEDTAAIYEMFTPPRANNNNAARGLKKENGIGPAEFEGFHKMVLSLVKDVRVTVDSYIEQGDIISAECTFSARNRRSNSTEAIMMKGCLVGTVVDGKILSASNYFDFLHLFEGLGLLPENTLENCLMGNKVF